MPTLGFDDMHSTEIYAWDYFRELGLTEYRFQII